MTTNENSAPMKIHLVRNWAAERIDDDVIEDLLHTFAHQLDSGYRIAFPVLLSGGKVTQAIALLTRSDDKRLKRLKDVAPSADSTHVFCLWAFIRKEDWMRFARRIVAAFPEQSEYGP